MDNKVCTGFIVLAVSIWVRDEFGLGGLGEKVEEVGGCGGR